MASYQGAMKQQHFMGAGLVATVMGLITLVMQFGGGSGILGNAPATSSNAYNSSSYNNGYSTNPSADRLAYLENAFFSLMGQSNPYAAQSAGYGSPYAGTQGFPSTNPYQTPSGQGLQATQVAYGNNYQGTAGLPYSNMHASGYSRNDLEVFFSPNGNCTQAIVREIQAAQKEICVQADTFTSEAIASALIAARRRGLPVWVILDKAEVQSQSLAARTFHENGIKVYVDSVEKVNHNKVIIIDSSVVITGSFSFTKSAEFENAENLLIIRNRVEVTNAYLADYKKHFEHSFAYNSMGNTNIPNSANQIYGRQNNLSR